MNRFKCCTATLGVIISVFLVFPQATHASSDAGGFGLIAVGRYVDPGTGSLVIQLAIGAVAGGLVAIKVFWGRIRNWFKNRFSGTSESYESDHAED